MTFRASCLPIATDGTMSAALYPERSPKEVLNDLYFQAFDVAFTTESQKFQSLADKIVQLLLNAPHEADALAFADLRALVERALPWTLQPIEHLAKLEWIKQRLDRSACASDGASNGATEERPTKRQRASDTMSKASSLLATLAATCTKRQGYSFVQCNLSKGTPWRYKIRHNGRKIYGRYYPHEYLAALECDLKLWELERSGELIFDHLTREEAAAALGMYQRQEDEKLVSTKQAMERFRAEEEEKGKRRKAEAVRREAARKAEAARREAARKAEAARREAAQEAEFKGLSAEQLEERAEKAAALQVEAAARDDWSEYSRAGKELRGAKAALLACRKAKRAAEKAETKAALACRKAKRAAEKAEKALTKAKRPDPLERVLNKLDFDQYPQAYAAVAKVVKETGFKAAMVEYRTLNLERALQKCRAKNTLCDCRPLHCRALGLAFLPWKFVGLMRAGGSISRAVGKYAIVSVVVDVELLLIAVGFWQGRYALGPRGGGLQAISSDVVRDFICRDDDDDEDGLPRASASCSSSPNVLDCGYVAAHCVLPLQRRNGEPVPAHLLLYIVEMALILDVIELTQPDSERRSMTTADGMLVPQELMHAVPVPTGRSADVETQLRTWHVGREGQGGLPASEEIQTILANELTSDQVKACIKQNISNATQQQQCVAGGSTTLWYLKSDEDNVLFVHGKPGPAFHRLPLKLQGHIAAVHLACGGVDKGRIQITLRAPGAKSEKHTLGWHYDAFRPNGKVRDVTIYSIKLDTPEYNDLWSIGKDRPAGDNAGKGSNYTGIMDMAETKHATNTKKGVLR